MPIPDLLWACPECMADRALKPAGRGEARCDACGTRFRRDRAARIRARRPDCEVRVLEPGEWVDRLPSVEALVDAAGEGAIRTARVHVRRAEGTEVVREGGVYLNRIEVLGPSEPAILLLMPDRLRLEPGRETAEEGPEKGRRSRPGAEWPLERLTAVQASSRTLQVKPRGDSLLSLRFDDDSVFLWELLLQAALRNHYERTGRGRIAEFQPRIVAHPHADASP